MMVSVAAGAPMFLARLRKRGNPGRKAK